MDSKTKGSHFYLPAGILMLVLCLFLPVFSVKAEESSDGRRTVRVAFPEQAGMSSVSRSGKVTGYNYDYLQKIAEYTGWKMEFVAYPDEDGSQSVVNALNDLIEGKVDLLGPMLKNAATEELLDFPSNNYGVVYTTLCALTTSNLRESNFKTQELVRVGLWEQAETRNAEVLQYLESQNVNYEIIYYPSSEEQIQALQKKDVDVISSVSLSPISNTRIVEQFAARPYYLATTKGNTDLIEELDAAISQLNQAQPALLDSLFETYFRAADSAFLLSEEQSAHILEMQKLHILCVGNDAPYSYALDGKPTGMLVSILDDFASEVGLETDYTFCDTNEEAESLIKVRDFDLYIGLPFDSEYCAARGFVQSEPVITSRIAYVHYPNPSTKSTIALVKGMDTQFDTTAYDNVLLYDNAAECIEAVKSKKADLTAGDRSVMEYYIYDTNSSLITSLISGETQDVCVAISKKCSTDFIAALNSYIHSLSNSTKTIYLEKANVHPNKFSIAYFVQLHPVATITAMTVIVVFLLFALFMLFYLQQIGKKNEQLRAANEVKSEFLTRMSHDIRTPMNGIVGLLSIADRCAEDPATVRKYHAKIKTASDYLLALINNVLDMSQLESQPIRLEDTSVSLSQLVENCVEITQPRAVQAHVVLQTKDLEHFCPPRVFASEQHINQILLNLISNAIKYNRPDGTVTVSASVTERTPDTVTCLFIVSDTGIGMSKEFQKRMFEPFAQEKDGARSEFKGTGLGLSIVKRIVDYKKGQIHVDSVPGKGTSIAVTLTFRIDKDASDENLTAKQEAENKEALTDASTAQALKGIHILAAEDNELNAEILQFLLKDAGADLTLVGNGALLVEEFASSKPGAYDCIVTDVMMPVMDGYEATRKLRSLKRPDAMTIPIIALTANAFSEDAKKALEAGMNAHVSKPLNMEKLTKTLLQFTTAKPSECL